MQSPELTPKRDRLQIGDAVCALQPRNDAGAGAHAQGDRRHICDLCLRAWRKAVAATYTREHGMMSPTAAL